MIKDMTATVPISWDGDKLTNFYRTFHKQANDSSFPKAVNLLLFGKSLTPETKICDITNGRVLANEIKIYVLLDRSAQSGAARADPFSVKNLSTAEQEAVQIVEANQSFALLSEYIGSLLAAYDPLSQAETNEIILKNFPLMDPKIQATILKCSKFYGATYDNPFVDDNVTRLMGALGIRPQSRDKQAIRDLFRKPETQRRDEAHQPQPAQNNRDEQRGEQPQVNNFLQAFEEQMNRQQFNREFRDRPANMNPQAAEQNR